ncbi:MAG TPA: hypothetical protein VF471_11580 [Pseudoxanthomonas sp.]
MTDTDHQIRERLNALPEAPLPDALWQRVDRRRRQKFARRKLGVGAGVFALAGVLAFELLLPTAGPDSAEKQQVAAIEPMPAQSGAEADIRAIDHALQAAYDRGASDAEVAPIWAARAALLAGVRSVRPAAKQDRG